MGSDGARRTPLAGLARQGALGGNVSGGGAEARAGARRLAWRLPDTILFGARPCRTKSTLSGTVPERVLPHSVSNFWERLPVRDSTDCP